MILITYEWMLMVSPIWDPSRSHDSRWISVVRIYQQESYFSIILTKIYTLYSNVYLYPSFFNLSCRLLSCKFLSIHSVFLLHPTLLSRLISSYLIRPLITLFTYLYSGSLEINQYSKLNDLIFFFGFIQIIRNF